MNTGGPRFAVRGTGPGAHRCRPTADRSGDSTGAAGHPTADTAEIDLPRQAFLRRFDIEHTFHMLKQTLGWTTPKLRDPAASDRWTWLVPAVYTQLHLARSAVADLRHPRERPAPATRLTPPPSGKGSGTSRCCGCCAWFYPVAPGAGSDARKVRR